MNPQENPIDTVTADAAKPASVNPRSEGLLPADRSDPDLQVAEEVAFDLQSDQARRVGAMPDNSTPGKPADAVAASLGKDGSDGARDDAAPAGQRSGKQD